VTDNTSAQPSRAPAGTDRPLIIFDGHCVLCSTGVAWMMKRDPHGEYRFAAIQQPAARAIYVKHGLDPDAFDTFMVYAAGRAQIRWRGVLAAARLMPPPWRWMGTAGRAIPDCLGDRLYDFVQRNRIGWFGKRETCLAPSAAQRHRFVDLATEAL